MAGRAQSQVDGFGLPVRLDWARDYRGRTAVVYGHVPVARPDWVNNTIDLDTCCVFGGSLTALRWPERELLSVPAARVHAETAKPLGGTDVPSGAQVTADALPDLADVTGVRHMQTGLDGRVRIDAERSAAAVEAMSRFAVPPQ